MIVVVFFLILLKGADIPCRISGINTVGGDVMGNNRSRADDYIVTNASIAKHNAVSTNENIITDPDDANFSMGTSFGCAGIMGKNPNVTS